MSEFAYALLLTFMLGSNQPMSRVLYCRDAACVETQIEHAHESPYLTRMRVFKMGEPTVFIPGRFGATMFPPIRDIVFG